MTTFIIICDTGAGGYIDYIQTSKKDPDLVEIIWVKFHDKNVGKKCYKGSVNKKK